MPNINVNVQCGCRHGASCGWDAAGKNKILDSDLAVGRYQFKQLYWTFILIGTFIAVMMGLVGWVAIYVQATGQSALMGASIAITVASIAIVATTTLDYVSHARQSRQNAVHHKEQMDAIRRLEDALRKNQGGEE